MENQNEFEDKNRQEPKEMSSNQENDSVKNDVLAEASAEEKEIGTDEIMDILPDEEDGDNRFMDNEEEIDDPLSQNEKPAIEEPQEGEEFSEFDEEEEE